jgi:LuxR family maltose regulon positive regulatory protein
VDVAMETESATRRIERRNGDVPFDLVMSKLGPPFARPGIVERAGLLRRLSDGPVPPVLSVVAPAGYGKTTLLRQWMDHSARPRSWLTLDPEDNDPVLLLTYLAVALGRVQPVDPEVFRLLQVELPPVRSITRMLCRAFAAWPTGGALVIDDVHLLVNTGCQDIVALLVEHAPPGSYLALSSRTKLPVPVARLRAEGRVLELGADDLALDDDEASALLRETGADLTDPEVAALIDVAEGWAVAIYLAGRSASARARNRTFDLAHVGSSRHIAAYANAELLSALPAETVRFLTRSSVLDRMSGPMCDAVLRTFGSAERLEELTHANLLVVPLDEHRRWYRYHRLFGDMLRSELELRDAAVVPELRRRAATWCLANDLPDTAIDYAMAADDAERAAHGIIRRTLPLYRSGRVATLQRWYDWFDSGDHMRSYPALAIAGAWLAALDGAVAAAERRAAAAELGASDLSAAADDIVLRGKLAMLRVLLYRNGMEAALSDARTAEHLIPADDAWRPQSLVLLGMVQLCAGSGQLADRAFERAVEMSREMGAPAASAVALGERALLALDRGDHGLARDLSAQAHDVTTDGRLHGQATSAFVYAVAARFAIRDGDRASAERLLTQAQRLRPRLTHAIPHLAVQARLELARTMLSLGDVVGGRTLLREVDDILRLRKGLGVFVEQLRDLRARMADTPVGTIGVSSLTVAELRLLPLLQTHLTFREIGDRLHISRHTVKTQAISIYRKFGVSSRGDAVRTAAQIGLLPD